MNDAHEDLLEALRGLGWKEVEGETVIGVTIALHVTLENEPNMIGCQVMHFGNQDLHHDAMHGLSEVVGQIITQQHQDIASQN